MGRRMPWNLVPSRTVRSLLHDHQRGSVAQALLRGVFASFRNCCSDAEGLLAATKAPPAVLASLTRRKQPEVGVVGTAAGVRFNSARAAASFAAFMRAGAKEASCLASCCAVI